MKTKFHHVSEKDIAFLDNENYNQYAKCYLYKANRIWMYIDIFTGQLNKQILPDVTADKEILKIITSFYPPTRSEDGSMEDHVLIAKRTFPKRPELPPVYVFVFMHIGENSFRGKANFGDFFRTCFEEAGKHFGAPSLLDNFNPSEKPGLAKAAKYICRFEDIRKTFKWIDYVFPTGKNSSKCEYLITSQTLEPGVDWPINKDTGFLDFSKLVTPKRKPDKLVDLIRGKC